MDTPKATRRRTCPAEANLSLAQSSRQHARAQRNDPRRPARPLRPLGASPRPLRAGRQSISQRPKRRRNAASAFRFVSPWNRRPGPRRTHSPPLRLANIAYGRRRRHVGRRRVWHRGRPLLGLLRRLGGRAVDALHGYYDGRARSAAGDGADGADEGRSGADGGVVVARSGRSRCSSSSSNAAWSASSWSLRSSVGQALPAWCAARCWPSRNALLSRRPAPSAARTRAFSGDTLCPMCCPPSSCYAP